MNNAKDIISRFLGEPLKNIAHSIYDNYVETNVNFRSQSGMKEFIIRRELSSCCDWCKSLAGIYEYGSEPREVYQRHDSCRCMVTFRGEDGTYTDVWSKKEYQTQREARIERERAIIEDQDFWKKQLQVKASSKARGEKCFDVTEEWLRRSGKAKVKKNNKRVLIIDGQELIIDGEKNVYSPSPRENDVANLIAKKFGVYVEINPKINDPQNFRLSDFFINGVRFDEKAPEGVGKHNIYNIVKDCEKQSHSFVIDLVNDTISTDEAIRQIREDVFRSTHTRFVDTVILIDKEDNIRVFERL